MKSSLLMLVIPCRWMIGDWQGCNPCVPGCKKQRAVKCIRPVGHGEQEADVIPESFCQGSKPKESQQCNVRTRRDNNNENTDEKNKNLGRENEMDTLVVKNEQNQANENSKTAYDENLEESARRRNIHPLLLEKRTDQNDSDPEVENDHKIKRGKVVFDKEDVKNLTLTIILERDDNNNIINFPKDFKPQPPPNVTDFTLVGMDAVKYIQRIQEEGRIFVEPSPT